jgi:hypothetical protein
MTDQFFPKKEDLLKHFLEEEWKKKELKDKDTKKSKKINIGLITELLEI